MLLVSPKIRRGNYVKPHVPCQIFQISQKFEKSDTVHVVWHNYPYGFWSTIHKKWELFEAFFEVLLEVQRDFWDCIELGLRPLWWRQLWDDFVVFLFLWWEHFWICIEVLLGPLWWEQFGDEKIWFIRGYYSEPNQFIEKVKKFRQIHLVQDPPGSCSLL